MSASAIQQKYQKEREKRLRADGLAQYIDLTKSEKFKHFQEDPWVNHEALNAQELPLKDGQAYKFLILGAGYGGLLFAVRLIQAGFKSDDIRLVDSAGGFGGTWYYNRYPGLQCDVESYMYMPLLEETGHMPTYKYAQGSELREYAETIAKKWDLETKTAFRLEIDSMTWQDQDKQWCVNIKQNRGPGQEILQMQVQAQFVITASGLLNYPQIPDIPGIANFRGHIFHTSRWDYKYTGGSQREPVMDVLKDKRVGVIGTGATAIQVVPQLAKYAKELFVFQRTPSAVDRRDNRKTDPQWWARETKDKNWQRRRTENFNSFLCNVSPPPAVNMVDDAWTHMPSYSALIGADKGIIAPDKVPAHLVELHAMDLVRQERVRARVEETVNDKATAEKLKSWYPGWCKRPTFHDEYLPTFNRPNVTLVDTNGKGADKTTQDGIIVAGKEYKVDLLVMSTGYRSPGKDVSPASRANMTVIGRDGKSLEEEWSKHGISTLHGCISRGFPNLFFPGPMQAAASVNFTSTLDQMATHVAYMASAGRKKAGQEKFTIEPTAKAQDEWSMMILTRAAAFAGVQGCTPSYFNREGETDRVRNSEEQMMAAKGAPWGEGMNSFVRVIEGWRAQGSMDGIEITAFEGDN